MKNLEQIERYLNGDLEENDLWEFRKALETDPQLQEEVRAFSELKKVMSQTKKIEIMEKMFNIHQNNQKRKYFLGFPLYRAAAAGLLLLATVGGGFFYFQSGRMNDKLFNEYYVTESGSFGLRSGNSTMDQPIMQGLQFYELGNYEEAIALFDKTPENLLGKLYRGLSYIELEKYKLAIIDFNEIMDQPGNLFVDQAQWYLALTYLKTNNLDEAKKNLTTIAADRGVYKTKAQKILLEMENK